MNDFRPSIRRALNTTSRWVHPSLRVVAPVVVTVENLNELCWKAGFNGVAALARHLGRNRVSLWKAVRWPDQFRPTYSSIQKSLSVR